MNPLCLAHLETHPSNVPWRQIPCWEFGPSPLNCVFCFVLQVMSVLLLIEYSLEVANGKGFCKDLDKDYYRIGGSWQGWEAGRDPSVLHCSLCLFHQRIWNFGSKAQEGIQALFGVCFRPRLSVLGCWSLIQSTEKFLFQRINPNSAAPSESSSSLWMLLDSPGNPGVPPSPFSPAVDPSSLTHTPGFLHNLGISRETLKCLRTPQWTEGTNPTPQ